MKNKDEIISGLQAENKILQIKVSYLEMCIATLMVLHKFKKGGVAKNPYDLNEHGGFNR